MQMNKGQTKMSNILSVLNFRFPRCHFRDLSAEALAQEEGGNPEALCCKTPDPRLRGDDNQGLQTHSVDRV